MSLANNPDEKHQYRNKGDKTFKIHMNYVIEGSVALVNEAGEETSLRDFQR